MRENLSSQVAISDEKTESGSDDEYQVREVVTYESDEDCDAGALANVQEGAPTFGNVSVVNSNDVHFGNKTIYQGPVTIKQFVYANGNSAEAIEGADFGELKNKTVIGANGVDNVNFVAENGVSKDTGVKDVGTVDNNNVVPVRKGYHILGKFPHRKLTIISLITVLFISIVILLAVLISKRSSPPKIPDDTNRDKENTDILVTPKYDVDQNLTLSNKLRIVSRLEWVAAPPVEEPTPLKTPVPLVIIHHTATENCTSQANCVLQVRLIQSFHMESRQWWDIGYNFLIGGDGSAYIGRGWTKQGSHLRGYNSKSIGIAFIGTYTKRKPPQMSIDACKSLIELGVQEGYISKDYKILAARQLLTTESPGKAFYEDIRTWPHWAETP